MHMIVDLAGIKIALRFSKETEKAIPFCRAYYQGFLDPAASYQATIQISASTLSPTTLFGSLAGGEELQESRLPNAAVVERLKCLPEIDSRVRLTANTLCAYGVCLTTPSIIASSTFGQSGCNSNTRVSSL